MHVCIFIQLNFLLVRFYCFLWKSSVLIICSVKEPDFS